jgi:hypothetical protein
LRPAAFASVVTLNLNQEDGGIADGPGSRLESSVEDSRPSWEELVYVLSRVGATVLASHEHGVLLGAQRHLIFVRRRSIVDDGELHDALRAVGLAVEPFVELLVDARRQLTRWSADCKSTQT